MAELPSMEPLDIAERIIARFHDLARNSRDFDPLHPRGRLMITAIAEEIASLVEIIRKDAGGER